MLNSNRSAATDTSSNNSAAADPQVDYEAQFEQAIRGENVEDAKRALAMIIELRRYGNEFKLGKVIDFRKKFPECADEFLSVKPCRELLRWTYSSAVLLT